MRYDAEQHKIMIACVYEHVSDFHHLKMVNFTGVSIKTIMLPGNENDLLILNYIILLFGSLYCHLELWVCLTSAITFPRF